LPNVRPQCETLVPDRLTGRISHGRSLGRMAKLLGHRIAATGSDSYGKHLWRGSTTRGLAEIGRASCRERVCQYVWISMVAGALKKKKENTKTKKRNKKK